MRVVLFALFVILAGPVPASYALEAVAQQPYWQGGGKNLLSNIKVDAVGNRVVHLSETITQILACNESGKLYDGTTCVSPGGIPDLTCPSGQAVTKIVNGRGICDTIGGGSIVPPSSPTITIPACKPGQLLAVKDTSLECRSVFSHVETVNAGIDIRCQDMVSQMNVKVGLPAGDASWKYFGAGVIVGGRGAWMIQVNQRNDCSPMTNISRGTGFIARDTDNAPLFNFWNF